ncbi:MAG: PAS domain S-box protein [Pseudomonadota bacterium]
MTAQEHPSQQFDRELAGDGTDVDQYYRLETLLKNLPGMAYRCLNLPHWPMDFVSDGCFDLCGYHRHEIESQQVLWGDFTHPDMIGEVDRKVRDAAENGEPFEVEYRIIHRSGQEKWVWERGRVVDRRDDGVAVLEGLITDITDRKQAETALVRAEAFSRAVLQSAVEAVITVDAQGAIESCNESACRMFRYALADMRGKHSRLLFETGDYRDFEALFSSIRGSESTSAKTAELRGCAIDGHSFPLHLSIDDIADPVLDHTEQKFVLIIRDLSHQRAAEKEVRKHRELLAHADRLNTLGEMAVGIAHEINQPLTAISMYAQSGVRILKHSNPDLEKLSGALDKLSRQALRAGAIIEHMQQLTRRRESKLETVDCSAMIDEVKRLAEVEAQLRNITVALRVDKLLPCVHCDPIQIQQVLLNLLRNGMEAMHQRGKVVDDKIVLRAQHETDTVRFSILDSGTGISDDLAQQLYKPFSSTKESGMGLGLSISRSIIEAHGGQLGFANNSNGGATFFFTLPVAGDELK